MKNIIRRTLALLCAVTLAFTPAGCAGSKDKKDDTTDTAAGSDSSVSADDNASTAESSGKFASIQDFVDSDLFREHLESKITDFEEKGLSMSFSAEDNKLIWNFKIDNPDLSDAIDPASLESALDSQASAFESVADALTTAVDVDNPAVLVRYLNSEGTELASREFGVSADSPAENDGSAEPDSSSDTDAAE